MSSAGDCFSRGCAEGFPYVVGRPAHVDFGLIKNNERICPEPYFTPDARLAVLAVIHETYPGSNMCY